MAGGRWLLQPGQWRFPHTGYVTLHCRHTSVSGEGDTLTISWVMRPERCFIGGCGEHIAYGYVLDRARLWGLADSGTWTLYPASRQARDVGSVARPTRLQMERLRKEIEACRSGLGEPQPHYVHSAHHWQRQLVAAWRVQPMTWGAYTGQRSGGSRPRRSLRALGEATRHAGRGVLVQGKHL
jgi:hypothetical protein